MCRKGEMMRTFSYDPATDIFTIDGQKYTGAFFDGFREAGFHSCSVTLFRDEEGRITMERKYSQKVG